MLWQRENERDLKWSEITISFRLKRIVDLVIEEIGLGLAGLLCCVEVMCERANRPMGYLSPNLDPDIAIALVIVITICWPLNDFIRSALLEGVFRLACRLWRVTVCPITVYHCELLES